MASAGCEDLKNPRWVFHPGWPGLGGPAGWVMVRLDVYASGDSADVLEKLVTVIAPGMR